MMNPRIVFFMNAPPSGPEPTVQAIYGPFLIGAFLSTFLYGVNIVQLFTYYETCQRDPRWMKAFIFYLFVALTLDSAFNILLVYQPLLQQFGQFEILAVSPFFLRPDAAMTVAISTPVQIFMAWRIKVLTGGRIIPVIIIALSTVSFLGGVGTTIGVSFVPQFAQFNKFNPAPISWLASTSLADVLITVTLAVSLRRGKTGVVHTDAYVSRLIRLTVQTGTITTIAAVADTVVHAVLQNTTIALFGISV